MTIDFPPIASPASREHLAETAHEINRLYRLPDRWLAEELLKLTRELRRAFPAKLGNPNSRIYDIIFAWHLVPEIAKRLGATRLLPNEATRADIVTLQDQDFRRCTSSFVANTSISRWDHAGPDHTPSAAILLSHDIANGNPVAFALDRLYPAPPAGQDHSDFIAHHIREISRLRGHPPTPYWSPALQEKIAPA